MGILRQQPRSFRSGKATARIRGAGEAGGYHAFAHIGARDVDLNGVVFNRHSFCDSGPCGSVFSGLPSKYVLPVV
jgi:hypothetical protein